MTRFRVPLVGDGMLVPCVDGHERPYVALDSAASTGVLEPVLRRVEEFLPFYSGVHRGSGYKSQLSTDAYESAREAILSFAGREGSDDIAIICRNTTEAINHLAYRLRLRFRRRRGHLRCRTPLQPSAVVSRSLPPIRRVRF